MMGISKTCLNTSFPDDDSRLNLSGYNLVRAAACICVLFVFVCVCVYLA